MANTNSIGYDALGAEPRWREHRRDFSLVAELIASPFPGRDGVEQESPLRDPVGQRLTFLPPCRAYVRANVRFSANCGLKSDLQQGPKSATGTGAANDPLSFG